MNSKNNFLKDTFQCLFYLLLVNIILTSCGDSESKYYTIIDNRTDYEIKINLYDSTIICYSNQETIVEEYWCWSVKKMSCMTPYIFSNNDAEVIVDEGRMVLTKDITDDNNWSCIGEEDWSLIMVGNYYSEIITTFIVNTDDIKTLE